MVECPNCHKKLTAKSLKYSHKNNCRVNKTPEQLPKESQLQIHVAEKPNIFVEIPERIIGTKNNTRIQRMQNRQNQMEKLISLAF